LELEERLKKIKEIGKTIGEYTLTIVTSSLWLPVLALDMYAIYKVDINSPEYKEMLQKHLDELSKGIELVSPFKTKEEFNKYMEELKKFYDSHPEYFVKGE